MMNNFLTDKDETLNYRNVVLEKNSENTMERICKQRGYFQESRNEKDT